MRRLSTASNEEGMVVKRQVPMTVQGFEDLIRTKHFTAGADVDEVVIPLFRSCYFSCVRTTTWLDFSNQGWSDEDAAKIEEEVKKLVQKGSLQKPGDFLHRRKRQRWHRHLQREYGTKQVWEMFVFSGRFSVAELELCESF